MRFRPLPESCAHFRCEGRRKRSDAGARSCAFALSRRGPLTQTELAEEMEIETPTLVRVLDGMEKQNLIERRSDANDRRAKRIHMTPDGKQTSEAVQGLAKELRAEIVADISTDDLRLALDVMRRLSANLQSLAVERAKP